MTITYPISQCKREVEAYELSLSEAQYKYEGHWRMHEGYRHYLNVWYKRLTESTNQAIELNRAIIERWDTASLIRVIETGSKNNPYMVVAALQLICEDPGNLYNHDIGCIIRDTNSLHSQFDIWHEINILEGELDRRQERDYCPDCECRRIDCECSSETPSDLAGWKQSDHI